MELQHDMTPSQSGSEQTGPRARATSKSPIVTRRRALTMAFHQAMASLGRAKKKAASGIAQAAAQVNQGTNAPKPPVE